jgi:AraC family transcriptional regulator of adaptative response/methylated-DNA-[protein]-cysteine methyltransferase
MVLATLFESEEPVGFEGVADVVQSDLWTADLETPFGLMKAMATEDALVMLEFTDERRAENQTRSLHRYVAGDVRQGKNGVVRQIESELADYFSSRSTTFHTPIRLLGSAFQESVWRHLQTIGYGHTTTYLQVAEAVATKRATRAVGKANGDNRLAIVVPCHRVIRADGHMCGYGGGIWRKQFLLALESGQPHLL